MVAELVLYQGNGKENADFLRRQLPNEETGMIGIFPGNRRLVWIGKTQVSISCSKDNLYSTISEPPEENSQLKQPRITILADSNTWYPIHDNQTDLWLLVRHKETPSRTLYDVI